MQIVVAGATGFIGGEVVRRALEAGHQVFPLVHAERDAVFDPDAMRTQGLVPVPFGASAEVLRPAFGLEPGAWIINAAGLPKEIPGHDPHAVHCSISSAVVELAQENTAARLVHFGPLLSATGDPFIHAKAEAEEAIRRSGVPWSVVRSAPVFGVGDALLDEIGAWMMRSPLIPRFLETVPLQPVYVGDAAQVLLHAPEGTHEIGGACLLWGELLAMCAKAAGKKLIGPRLSGHAVLKLARAMGNRPLFMPLIPFNEAGFRRHRMGYTVQDNALERLLGHPPATVEAYLEKEWAYRV